ncbi:hypothetical protein MTBLM1_140014 [Rhodospirillaceae bacterium LM-1]|nr:hypothetical protein MTBLM1_140014 [Rhodospirillaceae bacterium LM-1]
MSGLIYYGAYPQYMLRVPDSFARSINLD